MYSKLQTVAGLRGDHMVMWPPQDNDFYDENNYTIPDIESSACVNIMWNSMLSAL